jgi:hypothetical protein
MKYTFLMAALSLCVISCKKNSDSAPNKTDQLTSSDWKYDSGGISDANGNIIVNFNTTGMVPDCMLDNTVKFQSDGTGTVYENTNVCSGAPATSAFTWNFSQNETLLNLSGGTLAGLGGSFKIKTLSGTQLSVLKDTTYMGTSATLVVNLKH